MSTKKWVPVEKARKKRATFGNLLLSRLDSQFCLCAVSSTHIQFFPQVSIIASDWPATKQSTQFSLPNTIAFLQQAVPSTTQAELAERVSRGLPSTRIPLVMSLLTLQFSQTTVAHIPVRNKSSQFSRHAFPCPAWSSLTKSKWVHILDILVLLPHLTSGFFVDADSSWILTTRQSHGVTELIVSLIGSQKGHAGAVLHNSSLGGHVGSRNRKRDWHNVHLESFLNELGHGGSRDLVKF